MCGNISLKIFAGIFLLLAVCSTGNFAQLLGAVVGSVCLTHHFQPSLTIVISLLVRVSVFLRVTAAQGWLVGQRLRTAYIASLRVRFFKVVRKQIISRHAHNLS